MKRMIFTLLVICLMATALVGCGKSKDAPASTEKKSTTSTTTTTAFSAEQTESTTTASAETTETTTKATISIPVISFITTTTTTTKTTEKTGSTGKTDKTTATTKKPGKPTTVKFDKLQVTIPGSFEQIKNVDTDGMTSTDTDVGYVFAPVGASNPGEADCDSIILSSTVGDNGTGTPVGKITKKMMTAIFLLTDPTFKGFDRFENYTIDGYDALLMEFHMRAQGTPIHMTMVMVAVGSNTYTVSFNHATGAYDKAFAEVIDSIRIVK